MLKKYKWKCRLLVINTPNYKNSEYKKTKILYQKEIKNFHKRVIKLVTIISKNQSLFSDYNPNTTTPGLGNKDKKKALYTIKIIKKRDSKYQVNVISTMLGRAKKHPAKTKGMMDAIKIFKKWMKNYEKN